VLYSGDDKLRYWNPVTGALTRTFGQHTDSVNSVAFSGDGQLFASAALEIQLWNARTGKPGLSLNQQADIINSIAFSEDGTLLVSGSGSPPPDTQDPRILLYRVADGAVLLSLPGHNEGTRGVDLSPDKRTIVSVGEDNLTFNLKYWDATTGALIRTINTSATATNDVSYSPDGQLVATGDSGGIHLWSAANGALVRMLSSFEGQNITHVAFSPDGHLVAASEEGYGSNVEIWQVASGTLLYTLAGDPDGFMSSVAFTNDSAQLAATSGYTYRIQFWDVASGTLLQTYDQETGSGIRHSLPIKFQPGGKYFGYGRADATVDMARNPFAF
jgi:WD40 repeat protein